MAPKKSIRLASILRQDRMGDFKAVNSQLDSIKANLGTTGAGIGGGLTSSQNRQLSAIAKYTKRSTGRAQAHADNAEEMARTRYGTAMGGVTSSLFRDTDRTVLATKQVAGQAAKGAGTLAKGGQLGLAIEQAGAKEAVASAQYATAAALKYRAKQDAQLVSEHQMALKEYRLEREKLGLGPDGTQNQSLKVVGANAPADVYALDNLMTNGMDITAEQATAFGLEGGAQHMTGEEASGLTAGQLSQLVADSQSITDPNEAKYLVQVAKLIKSGSDPTEAATEAASIVFGDVKHFNVNQFNKTMTKGLATQETAALNSAVGKANITDGGEAALIISALKARGFSTENITAFLRERNWAVTPEEIDSIPASMTPTTTRLLGLGETYWNNP